MFKNKHTFTCEDVIYLQNRQRKIYQANFIATVVFTVGLWLVGKRLEKKEELELQSEYNLQK